MPRRRKPKKPLAVEATRHRTAKRLNIPTAEHEPIVPDEDRAPTPVRYPRNTDLDPQLVWRGKDEQDESDLVVDAPPLYIQEKVRPKALVEDLLRETKARRDAKSPPPLPLFGDFNGLPEGADRTEFYQHHGNWSNRMILGDSLRVMASLAEKEGLRGKVQCIYLDPPYGINFNSNFQWSTTSRTVKDGKAEHITREPEQVKAFRDTWRDGIHSYLSYLRDRLTVARDLLTESGSIFVQIGDENVHRVRTVMDEVFGSDNFISLIAFRSSVPLGAKFVPGIMTYLILYAKQADSMKFRRLFKHRDPSRESRYSFIEYEPDVWRRLNSDERVDLNRVIRDGRLFVAENLNSAGRTESCVFPYPFCGSVHSPTQKKSWKSNRGGLGRLERAGRLVSPSRNLNYKLYLDDYPVREFTDVWTDTQGAGDKTYVVQTPNKVLFRCLLMVTDPGDLVLDPTCGSGTTAYAAEQWGRRWITIDTSRVALALARSRIMGARYPFYTLSDSAEGQQAEAEFTGREPAGGPTYGDVREGFVYEPVPHITLRDIANNTEIDSIWEARQPAVKEALGGLNRSLHTHTQAISCHTRGKERADGGVCCTVWQRDAPERGESAGQWVHGVGSPARAA